MRLGLALLTLAIVFAAVAGLVVAVHLWTGGQAKAENGVRDAAAQKADAPKALAAAADDDDEEDADDEDGDDDDEDEVKVTIDQVPAAVKEAILREAGKNPIKEIEAETKNGQTIYEAEWVADGKKIELKLTADGKVLKKEVEDADDDGDDDDEKEGKKGDDDEDEVKLTIDQVPDAVKAAILAAAGSNAIKEIEAETKNGQTIYEAEWVADGKKTDLKLTADGKVLKKEVDDDD